MLYMNAWDCVDDSLFRKCANPVKHLERRPDRHCRSTKQTTFTTYAERILGNWGVNYEGLERYGIAM
ncbi:hypothetical protein WAI453_000972 [Rhynchosporium graminicola]